MVIPISGTQGYAQQADALVRRWQDTSFTDRHAPVRHLFPRTPSRVLDVGAGIGVDAAGFAAMGHAVTAVEPVTELRRPGMTLHADACVEWIDDHLPELSTLRERAGTFDLIMSLRHGPVPAGRRMFEVPADETTRLGAENGLRRVLKLRTPSIQAANRRAGVFWTRLAFRS